MTSPRQHAVFADTSAWIALFLKNDHNHSDAVTLYKKIQDSQILLYTSDYIIDETVTLMMQKSGYRSSLAIGNAILSNRDIEIIFINPDYFAGCWKHYCKFRDKNFSYTDVASFYLMDTLNIAQAFSFDRHFIQAGFALIH